MKQDKPSNTALIVAAGLQLVRHHDAIADALPDEAIRRGASVLAAASPRTAALIAKPSARAMCRALEQAVLPGVFLHFALRKRLLRDHAHAATAAGCRQIVVLGAGLDTLTIELLAADPSLCCIEIDHPASQAVKRRAAGSDAQGVHFISGDLSQQTLPMLLATCPAFLRDAPTLFVAEGLLMYVPLDAVFTLLEQMAAVAPDSRAAFTWLEPQANGLPNFARPSKLVDFWLKLRGEPFLSGMARPALPRFLRKAGFILDHVADSIDVLSDTQRAALPPSDLPLAGEYIAFAHTNPRRQS